MNSPSTTTKMNQPHHCSVHHHHHHHHNNHPEYHSHRHHHHHHHLLFIHPSSLSSSHPHHHHHHHVVPQCNFIPQNHNSNLTNPPPQIPQSALPLPSHTDPNLGLSGFQAPHTSQDTLYFQDDGVDEVEELEDDEDPIFVMTDEWREFFAKSEAKRREAKKLAKKQGKT